MKRINIFIITFLVVVVVIVQCLVFFIRTNKFATLLSREVNRSIGQVATLRIDKFDINIFPFRADVYGVLIRDITGNSIEAKKIRFELGIKDLFSRSLTFSEISIYDSKIYLNKALMKSDDKVPFDVLLNKINNIKIKELHSALIDGVNKVPFEIYKVSIKDSIISSLDVFQEVSEIAVTKIDEKVRAKISLTNVNLSKYISEAKDLLDEGSVSAVISENDFILEELKLVAGLSAINVNGIVRNIDQNIYVEGSGHANVDMKQFSFLLEDLQIHSGILATDIIFNGPLKKLEASLEIKGAEVVTKWSNLKRLDASVEYRNEILKVNKFLGKMATGSLALERPFSIYNNTKNRFENLDVDIKLENAFTNELLVFVPDLVGVKGFLSGDVNLKVIQDNLEINGGSNLTLNNFKLENKKNGKEILKNKNPIFLDTFTININLDKFRLNISSNLKFKNSNLIIDGFIDNEKLSFDLEEGSEVDFYEFGPIVNQKIVGHGPIQGLISGPLNDVTIELKSKLDDMNVLNFGLGSAESHLKLSLEKVKLSILNLTSKVQNSKLSGEGYIDFEKSILDLNIKLDEGNLTTTKSILNPIVKNINLDEIKDFDLQITARVSGGIDLDKINVDGAFHSRFLSHTNEEFTDLKGDLSFGQLKLEAKNITARKGQGLVRGNVFVDLRNDYLEYDFSGSDIRLSDMKLYKEFPIAYDGIVSGEFFGSGKPGDLSGRNLINIENAKISNYPVKGSKIIYFFNKDQKSLTANLLGGEVNLALELNNSQNDKKKSKLDLVINTSDIKKIFASLSEHNIQNKNLNGRMRASLKAVFDSDHPFHDLFFDLDVSSFEINNGSSHYKIDSSKHIKIINSNVENWDLAITSGEEKLLTKGSGNLEKEFQMDIKGKLDAGLLSLIVDQIKTALGKIVVDYQLGIKGGVINATGKILLQNLDISFRNLPVDCKKLNADFDLVGDKFTVKKFASEMGGGTLEIKGGGIIKTPYPELKLKTSLDGIKVPLYEKSYIVTSGQGELAGDRIPYFYSANLLLLHGEILDEFDQIGKSDKSKFDSKYVPAIRFEGHKSLINYSIQSEILRSIKVKNSITDLEMNGKIYLFGDLQNPKLNGSLSSPIVNSKFIFKGHEFFITYGKVDFISDLQDHGPLINFVAQSSVENYKVKLAVYGHVSDMTIDLTSTPALSQQDILSLLTLGITSSDSSKLQEDERSYLTSVGVGSLLADRFKINEGLKSSLGLNFTIAPELTQSGESLLPAQGTTSSGNSQYKSTTKLKVQKKVNELIDVSLASTVGSSQSQKQEVNINLNLSQNISVQGVYEVKSTNEDTTEQTPGSLGLDLLFRKTFK